MKNTSCTKTVQQSETTQVQVIMYEHLNGHHRLFGGKLVEWIDVVAAVVAIRHAGCPVTTVCIDNLYFKAAAHVGDLVVLQGKITYVGTTSMEVRVDTFIENQDGSKYPINHAYLTLVAMGEDEQPTAVPRLSLGTPQEQAEWDAGLRRTQMRKQRRKDFY